MSVNRRIQLNKSMGFQKRGANTSVLASKWLDYENVLFPKADIDTEATANSFEIRKLIRGDGKWAVGPDSTDNIAFYSILSTGTLSLTKAGGGGGGNFADAMYYFDGTGEFIYGIDDTGDVWKFNTNTEVFTDNVQSLGADGEQMMSYHPVTNKLYFMTDDQIYSQSGTVWDGSILTLPGNFTYKKMIPYKDWLIIFAENNGDSKIYAMFYDVINTPTNISDIRSVSGGTFIDANVIDNKLCTITRTQFYENVQEYDWRVSFRVWNGGIFQEINSIPFSGSSFQNSEFSSSDGSAIIVGITSDEDEKVGVYRFHSDGKINVMVDPLNVTAGTGQYRSVLFSEGEILVSYKNDFSNEQLAQLYDNRPNDYNNFGDDSVYITPFLEDPYETKDMTSVYMSFRKTDDDQQGTVQYRTDENDAWTTILSFDGDNGANIDDRQQIVYNNNNQLPQFKEIQFRITSARGLNITSVGYKFDYIDDDHE